MLEMGMKTALGEVRRLRSYESLERRPASTEEERVLKLRWKRLAVPGSEAEGFGVGEMRTERLEGTGKGFDGRRGGKDEVREEELRCVDLRGEEKRLGGSFLED